MYIYYIFFMYIFYVHVLCSSLWYRYFITVTGAEEWDIS